MININEVFLGQYVQYMKNEIELLDVWPKSQLSIQSSLICCAYGGLSSTSIFVYSTQLSHCLMLLFEGTCHSHSLQVSLMFIRLTTVNSTVLLVAWYPSSCPLPLIHAVNKSNSCRKSAKETRTDSDDSSCGKWKLYLRTENLMGQNLPLPISILVRVLLSRKIVLQK